LSGFGYDFLSVEDPFFDANLDLEFEFIFSLEKFGGGLSIVSLALLGAYNCF